jgi:hypothetical protein
MKRVKHGCVQVELPESITPPKKAGKMSKKEVRRLLKSPRGMVSVCHQSASAIERIQEPFSLPQELSPGALHEAAQRSEEIAKVMQDLSVILLELSQARLLFDHDTFSRLRYLKDIVKAYAKRDPMLRLAFAPLFELFGRSAATRKERKKSLGSSTRSTLSLVKEPGEEPSAQSNYAKEGS